MDTRLLRAFQAVSRHGGLSGASKELHLTPSALSHRLKALETEVGCRLFERSGRRMTLTQAGEQLQAAIRQPLESLAAAAAGLRALGQWGHGRIRMGLDPELAALLMPGVVADLRREFPKLNVVIESGAFSELGRRIRERRIDLAVGVAEEPEPGLELRTLFEDELLWVMPPQHPWVDGRPLTRDDVRTEPLIAHPPESPTGRLIDRHFRALGIEPTVAIQTACPGTMKALVCQRQGVAILAPWMITPEWKRSSLRARPLTSAGLRRQWRIGSLAGRRFTLAEERAQTLLMREAEALWKDRQCLIEATDP